MQFTGHEFESELEVSSRELSFQMYMLLFVPLGTEWDGGWERVKDFKTIVMVLKLINFYNN